jgi:SAM-dependent methyltransferase
MSKALGLGGIRSYWEEQARVHGQSPSASWSDTRVIEMEIREIGARLEDGERVLDIGCANGFSTVQFATLRNVRIRGVDFIPEMIAEAARRLEGPASHLSGRVEFAVGDITTLGEPSGAYDKVVVVRVVINLGDWERQRRGLAEAARVVRPGGRLLLSEATVQGWKRLNSLRSEWGLTEIPMPPFNLYLDEEQVVEALQGTMRLVEIVDFASTYYVGTRVLKPLLAKAAGLAADAVADPNMEWNRWLSQLPAWGDYGTQKLFVFEKR